MPEETFVAVARMAVEVEKAFGGPRDVEFAVKDGKMYLLQVKKKPLSRRLFSSPVLEGPQLMTKYPQARPITTIETWTDDELLHELDDPICSSTDEMHTKANVG